MENQPHQETATPEEIWSILRATSDKSARETEELKQLIKENEKLVEKLIRETGETGKQMKETDRRLRKLDELFNSQWGKLVESLVEGDLVALLQARGIAVQTTHPRVSGRGNGEHYEFDILAVNGDEVVVVEIKTTLRAGDVKRFLSKLAKFTGWLPEYKGRKILGAVAYLKADHTVVVHAERQGLFVIRATGNSASIINEAGFQPRVFE